MLGNTDIEKVVKAKKKAEQEKLKELESRDTKIKLKKQGENGSKKHQANGKHASQHTKNDATAQVSNLEKRDESLELAEQISIAKPSTHIDATSSTQSTKLC